MAIRSSPLGNRGRSIRRKQEWKGTRLLFQLNESKGQTLLLRFTHASDFSVA
jgi:hypothetical protein